MRPPGYGPDDAMKDANRLHQLNCKRMSPPSRGGGELKGAEDEEEAFLTARLAAYRHSPEGRGRTAHAGAGTQKAFEAPRNKKN